MSLVELRYTEVYFCVSVSRKPPRSVRLRRSETGPDQFLI